MGKIDSAVRKAWRAHPDQEVDLIIRYSAGAGEVGAALARHGVHVKRRFDLTHSVSVRCTAQAALELVRETWVIRVEVDRPVKALRR